MPRFCRSVSRQLPLLLLVGAVAGCLGPGTLNEENACPGDGRELVADACLSCHSVSLSGDARSGAPAGVNLDTDADLLRHATNIRALALELGLMPPVRPLSDCEKDLLSALLDEVEAGSCLASCSGRACGDDGCGGACGTCSGSQSCNDFGQCFTPTCTPDCAGRVCGDDGCGDSCGTCGSGEACSSAGLCECAPDCTGRACGGDGCGGSCGTCNGVLVCNTNTGHCGATCTADCTGRVCGDDGCGGSCGTCGSAGACNASGQCACAPTCGGAECGDDGCGGTCGTCAALQSCEAGTCTWPSRTFDTDVWPILSSHGCSGSTCHGSVVANEGLDMRDAATAYANLVGVQAGQCSRLRVSAGDIAGSYLINKVTGVDMCSGFIMPKANPTLSAAEVDVLRAWIATGAAQ